MLLFLRKLYFRETKQLKLREALNRVLVAGKRRKTWKVTSF